MTDEDAPTAVATIGRASATNAPALDPHLEDRYELGGVLGRGGMGEVRFAHDLRVDREVAVKLMRPEQRDDDTIARFFREARVQGRLDHPAIPPVHDLGVDLNGNPYFVMKRLAGITLAEVLAAMTGDPVMRERWPRRLLLARYVDVCLAVELAHTRDIVHRDLKPANIMLGDFGEVYVLDWGLARVIDDARRSRPIGPVAGDSDAGHTVAGSVLGTPGYMPPEQIRGSTVTASADVYALGCILYEILTNRPALPHGLAALEATLAATCHRPSERFPELSVSPELDDLCARATAADARTRPSARAVADAVQAYLDGDRDLARRRALAIDHAVRAQDALTNSDDDDGRARAMREAGRAIVLDPNNLDAQAVLAHLMLETPNAMPDEARITADAERGSIMQKSVAWLAKGYAGNFAIMCVLFLAVFPVRHYLPIIAMLAVTAVTNVLLWYLAREPRPMGSPMYLAIIWMNCLALAVGAIVLGPLLIVPIYLIGTLAASWSQPIGFRWPTILLPYLLTFLIPLGLEWTGVLPSTYHVEHRALLLTPWVVDLTPVATLLVTIAAMASQSVIICSLMFTQTREQQVARDRLHAQSWHLKQLLPRRTTGQRARASTDKTAVR